MEPDGATWIDRRAVANSPREAARDLPIASWRPRDTWQRARVGCDVATMWQRAEVWTNQKMTRGTEPGQTMT